MRRAALPAGRARSGAAGGAAALPGEPTAGLAGDAPAPRIDARRRSSAFTAAGACPTTPADPIRSAPSTPCPTGAGSCAVAGCPGTAVGWHSTARSQRWSSEHLNGERMLARERVANVRKHWVRLVTACNSRCVFCLDTDTPRGVYIPEDEVRRELIRGREQLQRGQGDPVGRRGLDPPQVRRLHPLRQGARLQPHPDRHQRRDVLQARVLPRRRRRRPGRDHLQPARPHAGAARPADRHAGRLPQADEGHDARHPRGPHHRQRRRLHQQAERPVHRPDRRPLPVGRRARVRSPARHPAGRRRSRTARSSSTIRSSTCRACRRCSASTATRAW